jgi:predicted DNA-binding transcriptional regulator YafY
VTGRRPHLPQTLRIMQLLRAMRHGRPIMLAALARAFQCSEQQIARDLRVLTDQGCLVEGDGDWVRMVDDHLDATDHELDLAVALLCATAPVRRRRARRAA